MTDPNVTPFLFLGSEECSLAGRPAPGASELSNLYFVPYSPTSPTGPPAFGVEAHAPVQLEDLRMLGYTQGVRIVANASAVAPALKANANSWRMTNVQVQTSLHAGVWIDGPDTNVGLGLSIKSTSNCTDGVNQSTTLGQCADVYEGSFLGSTIIAASTGYAKDKRGNTDPADDVVFPGIVLGDSANSRGVCVGCYIEGGYGGGDVAATANVVGGIGTWTGGGNRLEGNRISGLEAVGSDGLISVKFGALTGGGALTLTPINATGTYPLRFKYDPATFSVLLNVANVGAGNVLRIGSSLSAIGGYGGLLLAPNSTTENVWINNSGSVLSRQVP